MPFLTQGSTNVVFVIYSFLKKTTKRKNAERIIAHPASSSKASSHFIQNVVTVIPSSAIAFQDHI